MALFPFYRYRFFDDPFDRFDSFDPWWDFDRFPSLFPVTPRFRSAEEQRQITHSSSNMLNGARSLEQISRVPPSEPFRVQLNVDGFNPDSIQRRVEGRHLIVEGKQEDRRGERDYTIRELRKTYELPEHVDPNRLTSYRTPNNSLVIEAPIGNPQIERRHEQANNENRSLTQFGQYRDPLSDYPRFSNDSNCPTRIVDKGNNQKQLEMIVDMKNYRPEEIKVSVKNNELIIEGEHRQGGGNRSEKSSFYQSTTLPRGTQLDQLQSHFHDDGQLRIEAPYI